MTNRKITVDPAVGTCYISLSTTPIVQTDEFSDDVLVDLDEYGVAVGIEILRMTAVFPLTDLRSKLHIHSRDESFLASLLPTLSHSLRFTAASAPDAEVKARTAVDRGMVFV